MQEKIENERDEYEYYKKWAEDYSAVAKDMKKHINELKKELKKAVGNEAIIIQRKIKSYDDSYYDCTETARVLLQHANAAKLKKRGKKW